MSENFLDKYFNYASKYCDAPEVYHRCLSFVLAGVIMGRHRVFKRGTFQLFPNVLLTLIGPSGIRKSGPIDICESVLRRVDNNKILSEEFSPEGLFRDLKEKREGIVFFQELKTLMGLLRKDYMAGAKAFLTRLYDCPNYIEKKLSKETIVIENSFFSLVSATTFEWLRNSVENDDIESGFLPRFLFAIVEENEKYFPLPPRAPVEEFLAVADSLKALKLLVEKETEVVMDFIPAAEKMYIDWAVKFKKEKIPLSPLFNRMPYYLIKLSMIVETCLTGSLIISQTSLGVAMDLLEIFVQSTTKLLASDIACNSQERCEKLILKQLEKKNQLLKGDLMNFTNYSKFCNLRTFNEALQSLLESSRLKFDSATKLYLLNK